MRCACNMLNNTYKLWRLLNAKTMKEAHPRTQLSRLTLVICFDWHQEDDFHLHPDIRTNVVVVYLIDHHVCPFFVRAGSTLYVVRAAGWAHASLHSVAAFCAFSIHAGMTLDAQQHTCTNMTQYVQAVAASKRKNHETMKEAHPRTQLSRLTLVICFDWHQEDDFRKGRRRADGMQEHASC